MDPIHAMSVPEILVQRILTDIATQKIRIGDRLPAQRELAQQYKISNSSVREAMQTLQGMGIVEVRHPTGTFVVGEPVTSTQALLVTAANNPEQFREAMEARCLIEMDITRLATLRASKEQTDALSAILDEMTEALRSGEVDLYTELDVNFHIAMAQSVNNIFLANYVHTLRTVIGSYLKLVPGSEVDLINHRAVVEAIRSRSIPRADAAARTLLLHVTSLAVAQDLLPPGDYEKISELLKIQSV